MHDYRKARTKPVVVTKTRTYENGDRQTVSFVNVIGNYILMVHRQIVFSLYLS